MVSSKVEPSRTVWLGLFSFFTSAITPRKKIIILKLDFEKAFDKIEHPFILEILKFKGFSETWINWVKNIWDLLNLLFYSMES